MSLVNRYYDPTTDQFLSVDPDVAETGQPYAFTGDNPLNATDPLGLKCKKGHSCPKPKPKKKPKHASTPYGGASVEVPTKPVVIRTANYKFTITGSVEVSGRDANPHVSVSTDGSIDVKDGNDTATFSSEGALAGVSGGVPGTDFSISNEGISYTTTQEGDVGPDRVTTDITATFGPSDYSLPGSAEVGAAVTTVVGGATYLAKQAADACAAQPEVC